MVLLGVFLPVTLIDLLIVFAFVMLLGFFIQLSIAIKLQREATVTGESRQFCHRTRFGKNVFTDLLKSKSASSSKMV
jgi:hypothetical protein